MSFNLSRRANPKIGIKMSGFCDTAKQIRCGVAEIRTVDEVESAGSGFLSASQRPKILFEGHIFYHLLNKQGLALKAHELEPSICYPHWTKQFYIGREGEYSRLAKATELCHRLGVSDDLALMSASWGRFQIMGENFAMCGYASVEAFVEDMFQDESLHLRAFGLYLLNAHLDDDLRAHRWVTLASGYNGPGYKRNNYPAKLSGAFNRFSKVTVDCAAYRNSENHVVQAMPGDRVANPDVDGFENTSLDDRYASASADDGLSESSPSEAEAEAPPEVADSGASTSADEQASTQDTVEKITDAEQTADAVQGEPSSAQTGDAPAVEATSSGAVEVNGTKPSGFWSKITGITAGIFTGAYTIPKFDLSDAQLELIKSVFPYIAIGLFVALCWWYFVKKHNNFNLTKLFVETNANPAVKDVKFLAPPKSRLSQKLSSVVPSSAASVFGAYIVTIFALSLLVAVSFAGR